MTVHHPEIIISRCWNNKFVAASKCWKLHLAFPFSNAVVELLGKILLHATGIQVSWFQIPLYIYIYVYIMLRYMHAPKTDKNRYVSGSPRKGLGLLNQGHLGSVHTHTYIYIYIINHVKSIYIYIHTWNLFVLYFGVWTLQNKVFSNQNRGHLGSVCIYIYVHL